MTPQPQSKYPMNCIQSLSTQGTDPLLLPLMLPLMFMSSVISAMTSSIAQLQQNPLHQQLPALLPMGNNLLPFSPLAQFTNDSIVEISYDSSGNITKIHERMG